MTLMWLFICYGNCGSCCIIALEYRNSNSLLCDSSVDTAAYKGQASFDDGEHDGECSSPS
jgi:hypothetical protein